MSVYVTAWVFEHAPKNLTSGEMVVALVLAEHANGEGGMSYPSIARIARMARMSERNAQYTLRSLVEKQVIEVAYEATNRRPTVYRFPSFRGAADFTPTKDAGVQPTSARGEAHCTSGVKPIAPEPSIEPSGTVQKTTSSLVGSRRRYTDDFERFWELYPSVTNNSKKRAAVAWEKLKQTDRELAIQRLPAYIASETWDIEGRIPHTATFLNGRLFDQEPAAPRARGSRGAPPDPAMAAWLAVVKHKQTGNGFRVNDAGRVVVPGRILDAAEAVGGIDAIDPTNGYQRKDFLAAYRAAEVAT